MGRDLSKRYSLLFEGKGVNKVFSFLRDVYRTGKLREFSSFVVWEALHRLGLFRKGAYLNFNSGDAMILQSANLTLPDFDENVGRTFRSHGLCTTRLQHNWKLLFVGNNGEIWGSIYPDDKSLCVSTDHGASAAVVWRFPEKIKSIFVSSKGTVFVCIKGSLHRSTDRGRSFEKSLELGSPESFFRFNNAMTETPAGVLVIGEYGNVWDERGWRNLANLYFSNDDGATWQKSDFLIRNGTNKHVHIVSYSALLDRLLVADGDNKKRLWISGPLSEFHLGDPQWRLANHLHIQTGGYTSITESHDKIFLGTDYQGGTNFIVETRDGMNFTRKIVPDPYRRNPVDNLVQRKSGKGHEIWAHLASFSSRTKGLLMYSKDDGKSWNKVLEYLGPDVSVWLISSSAETLNEVYIAIKNSRDGSSAVYKISDADCADELHLLDTPARLAA